MEQGIILGESKSTKDTMVKALGLEGQHEKRDWEKESEGGKKYGQGNAQTPLGAS